jgi:hypothetical protein
MTQQQLEFVDKAHAYVDRQVKKAQIQDYLPSQNPLVGGLGFVFPESQDAAVIDLEMEMETPMTKNDFSLLSTTLDGIVNRINVLSNEMGNPTGIIVRKLEEMMAQRLKKDQAVQTKRPPVKRKAPETDPCYICGSSITLLSRRVKGQVHFLCK